MRTIALLVALTTFAGRIHAQHNTFSYLTWSGDDEWKARVVKTFDAGEDMPRVRFQHLRVTPNGYTDVHYEDFINYLSGSEKWQATIRCNPADGSFTFNHCKEGGDECHDDVVMNYREVTGEDRQLTIRNCTPEQFRSRTRKIEVSSRVLGRWRNATPSHNDELYISWENENCGCATTTGGYKHYLYNTSGRRYRVTIQSTLYTTPAGTASRDYLVAPGGHVYIGCSQAQSHGCHTVDFAITGYEVE